MTEEYTSPLTDKTHSARLTIKVGVVGDSGIGKTSLIVKYIEGTFDEDYIQTLGINFMEKTVTLRGTEITFSVWDLGGVRDFINMLPLVCNDASAVIFVFDLSKRHTLNSVKEWWRQVRGFNKTAFPILVGNKYDLFIELPPEEQAEITKMARAFAKAIPGGAPLIFCSSKESINVPKIFKLILSKVCDLKCTLPRISGVGEPILEY